MNTYTAPIFIDNDSDEAVIVCLNCAKTHHNPAALTPETYTFNSATDDYHSLCYFCDTPIPDC